MSAGPDPESFLSGSSGHVAGLRRRAARTLADRALDLAQRARGSGRALDRLAERRPPRDVLVLGVYRPERDLLEAAIAELHHSRHRVRALLGSLGRARAPLARETVATSLAGGKFENLNAILATARPAPADWTLVVDDDVVLASRFLDRFVALCEQFDLALAQPAQTLMSHAAWPITRRRAGSLLRETRFVEIGPVTAFRRDAAAELLPFPDLRFGWGLELHWAALAGERGWRLGIVDALPVRHELAPVASDYSHADAVAEGRRFLADRPHLTSDAVREPVAVHRRI